MEHVKHVALNKHLRWPLYKKLRRAIRRELEADRKLPGAGLSLSNISERTVDDYLRTHLGEIMKEMELLFRNDLKATEARDRDQQLHNQL